jgi:hypothetical protein
MNEEIKRTIRADKNDETEYVIKVPRCIAPSVIFALLQNAADLPKKGAPIRHVQLASELASDLKTQFCGD